MKRPTRLAALLWLVLAAGCKNDSQQLGPDAGVLRAMHAIPDLGVLTMNLDSQALGDFDYAAIRGINRPGDGNHEVAFDVKLPGGDEPERLETLHVATSVDRAQTFVLTGTADDPNVITWEQPARNWDEEVANSNNEITILEVSFGHAALSRGPLDFYVGPSPLDPTASTPIASLGYSDLSPTVEIDADIVEMIVTPAGDPTTELYESAALSLPAATSLLFVAFDGIKLDDGDTPWLQMRSMGEAFSNVMPNRNVPAHARAVHSARNSPPFDLIRQDNDDTVVAGIAFRDVTPYFYVPSSATAFDLTPAGDPDEVVTTVTLSATPGADGTIIISGEPDEVRLSSVVDDNRRISTAARFRAINGAVTFPALDFYVLQPDTSVDDVNPTVALLTYPLGSSTLSFKAGDYDLVFTEAGRKDIAVGPVRVRLRNAGVYSVVATEAADEDRLELILLDDFVD